MPLSASMSWIYLKFSFKYRWNTLKKLRKTQYSCMYKVKQSYHFFYFFSRYFHPSCVRYINLVYCIWTWFYVYQLAYIYISWGMIKVYQKKQLSHKMQISTHPTFKYICCSVCTKWFYFELFFNQSSQTLLCSNLCQLPNSFNILHRTEQWYKLLKWLESWGGYYTWTKFEFVARFGGV